MSDDAPLGNGSFRSTVIGGAPRVWQRILVSRYADAKGRLSLSQTCSAARSLVLQHSRRFKARLALNSVAKDPEALHRRLRSVKQALRIRGQQGGSLYVQESLAKDPSILTTAITALADVGQHVHTLLLPCESLPPVALKAGAQAFPNLLRLSLGSESTAMQHGLFNDILDDNPEYTPYGMISLPPPSVWPRLLQLAIYEDLVSPVGKPKVTGLPPYLQQLDSLSLHDRQPHDPAKTVLTSPATLLRNLKVYSLTDAWVKVLLRHAPVLERVTAESCSLQQSHAASQCNWQQITLYSHQDVSDLVLLPRRRAGKLTVYLEEQLAFRHALFKSDEPLGVLDLTVTHSPAHPTMLQQRYQQDLTVAGMTTVRLQPTTELQQRSASQQATAIQRYLPVLAALWQPSYQLQVWAWELAPEVLRMLMRAVARVQAQYVSFTGCDFTKFRARTLNLPADFPALPVTRFSVDLLTDDWISLLRRHMPAVQRVECDAVAVVVAHPPCTWTHLTVRKHMLAPELLLLPLPPAPQQLTVLLEEGLTCAIDPQTAATGLALISEAVPRINLVNQGITRLSAHARDLTPSEQAPSLREALNLASLLPPPACGVLLHGWSMTRAVMAELQHLPQWPAELQAQAQPQPPAEPADPPLPQPAVTQSSPELHDRAETFLLGGNMDEMDGMDAKVAQTMSELCSEMCEAAAPATALPPLPCGKAHATLHLDGLRWSAFPAYNSQLVQFVPKSYTTWSLAGSAVPEATVRAICDAAITHRSVQYPLVVEVVLLMDEKGYVKSVAEYVREQGGEQYVTVRARRLQMVSPELKTKTEGLQVRQQQKHRERMQRREVM